MQKGAQVDSKNNVSIFILKTNVVTVMSDNFPVALLLTFPYIAMYVYIVKVK